MNSSFALTRKVVAWTVGVGLLCTALTASLAFAANPPLTATFSSTAPVQPASTGQNPIPVTLTFSEGVTNFTQSDITVSNGSITNLASTSDSVVTFGIIPSASGSVSVDMNAGIVTGTDGQTNQAAPELQFIYDPNASDAPGNTATTTTATSTQSQTAYLSLSVYSGPPGTAFNAVGNNFNASETVDIGFAGATTTATADASGNFSTPLTVPANMSAGPADIDATGATSGLVATNSFYVESTTTPVVTEVTPVPTPNDGSAQSYTFSSTEAGTITLGGGCSSDTTSTDATTTTITLNPLSSGTYNCTLTVTDVSGDVSNTLDMTAFTVNTPASAPASSGGGGGGGGGGMIVGSGPLAPGYVNTNPQPNLVATVAPAPVAVTPIPEPTVVTFSNPPSTVGVGSSATAPAAVSSSAPAPAPAGGVTPIVTISTSSTSTPGVPNTGEPAQTAAVTTSGTSIPLWVWIVLLIVVVVGGGVWMFSSEF